MKQPRICMNCLTVVPAKAIKYGEDAEENRKLDVIDAQTRCYKCNAKLTQYIHKVIDRVTDPDILKQFGITSGDQLKMAKLRKAEYDEASAQTAAQLQKDIEKFRPR